MKTTIRGIFMSIILFTVVGLSSGQDTVVITFDPSTNIASSCNTPWMENGVTLTWVNTTSQDCDGGSANCFPGDDFNGAIGMAPGRVSLDISGIAGTINSVEVDFFDFCGTGCSKAFIYNGSTTVSSTQNSLVGALDTKIMTNPGGVPIDQIAVSSCEGQVNEIRILRTITGGGCPAPMGLSTSSLTSSSVTLNWMPSASASSYIIMGGAVGSPVVVSIATNSTTFNVANLPASSSFYWNVKAVCASGDSSMASANDTFTTTAPCAAPNPIGVQNLTSNSVTLTWTPQAGAMSYTIYGRVATMPPGPIVSITAPGSASSLPISNLPSCTSYEWSIVTICAGGAVSALASPSTFTTLGCPSKASGSQELKAASELEVSVYPNPGAYQLNVQVNERGSRIRLYNSVGQLLTEVIPESNRISLDVSNLSEGLYLLEVQKGNRTFVEKVMIAR